MLNGLYLTRSIPTVIFSHSVPRSAHSQAGLGKGSLSGLGFDIAQGWLATGKWGAVRRELVVSLMITMVMQRGLLPFILLG